MKSNGKKFLSALLVSSMVLTSSLGFMPRTAQAIDDAQIYSFSFEYIHEAAQAGNRLLKITTEETLSKVDKRKISIKDNTAQIGDISWAGKSLKVEVEGVDPEIKDYTLVIAPGALEFSGTQYKQLAPIEINFKSYEIMPGFRSIFKDIKTANEVFDQNKDLETIRIFGDSEHILKVEGKTVSGEVNWTELLTEGSAAVDSITYTIQGETGEETIRKIDTKNSDDKFATTYAGISGIKNFLITAYDANGKKLDEQVVKYNFGGTSKPNFDAGNVAAFDPDGVSVRELIDGTATLDGILAGKSYAELDNINVDYSNVKTIIKVSTASELANVLGKLGANGELAGEAVKIKLEGDIVLGTDVNFAHNASIIVDGGINKYTISGANIILGDPNEAATRDKTVSLSNLNISGNVTVDVGSAGNSYLTNVDIASGNEIIVISGGTSSVRMIQTVADTLKLQNTSAVRAIASQGTIISNTIAEGSEAVVLVSELGGKFNVVNLNTEKVVTLNGEKVTPYDTVNVGTGVTPEAKLVLGENTVVTNLNLNSPTAVVGTSTSQITNATADSSLADGAVNLNDVAVVTYDPTDKFIGTGSATAGDPVDMPTATTNEIRIVGDFVDSIQSDAAGKSMTLKIVGSPRTIEWDITEADVKTNLADLFTTDLATAYFENDANVDSVSFSSDKTEMTIVWKNSATVVADETVVVAQPTKTFFKSIVTEGTTSEITDHFTNNYDTYYKPVFSTYENDGSTVSLNSFTMVANNQGNIDDVELTAANISSAENMKWWKTGGQVEFTNVTDSTLEYATDIQSFSALANNAKLTIDNQFDLDGGEATIAIRSLGDTGNGEDRFVLREGEVWLDETDVAADPTVIELALNDDEITKLHLSGKLDTVNLTAEADITRTTPVLIDVYEVNDDREVTTVYNQGQVSDYVTFGTGTDVITANLTASEIIEGTEASADDIIITLVGDTFDAGIAVGDLTLANMPAGVTIDSIVRTDDTHVKVTLATAGTDYDADDTDATITIASSELTTATTNLVVKGLEFKAIDEDFALTGGTAQATVAITGYTPVAIAGNALDLSTSKNVGDLSFVNADGAVGGTTNTLNVDVTADGIITFTITDTGSTADVPTTEITVNVTGKTGTRLEGKSATIKFTPAADGTIAGAFTVN